MSGYYNQAWYPSIETLTLTERGIYAPRSFHHGSYDPPSPGGGGSTYPFSPEDGTQLPLSPPVAQHQHLRDSPYLPPPEMRSYISPPHSDIRGPNAGTLEDFLNRSISPTGLETRFDPTRQWPNQSTAQYNPAGRQTVDWRDITGNRYRSRPQPLAYQPQGMYMTEPYFSDSPPSSTSSKSYESASPLTVNLQDLESNEDQVEAFLRQRLHIPPGLPVDLSSIPDPLNGERPTQKLQHLVELAIFGSTRKKLALQEIYAALANRFTWFRESQHEESWKGSIRHLLSLQGIFRSTSRPLTEPGKGSYWCLDIYTNPNGTKRTRKRRSKHKHGSRDDEDDDDSEGNTSRGRSQDDGDDVDLELSERSYLKRTMPHARQNYSGVQVGIPPMPNLVHAPILTGRYVTGEYPYQPIPSAVDPSQLSLQNLAQNQRGSPSGSPLSPTDRSHSHPSASPSAAQAVANSQPRIKQENEGVPSRSLTSPLRRSRRDLKGKGRA